LYSIEWTPEKIDFFVDNKLYNHFANEHKTKAEWPFDDPFYFIMNIAIGGGLGGKMGVDDKAFPATMEVDYVRVYDYQ
jgi:beta-glucanase (GH16 family)